VNGSYLEGMHTLDYGFCILMAAALGRSGVDDDIRQWIAPDSEEIPEFCKGSQIGTVKLSERHEKGGMAVERSCRSEGKKPSQSGRGFQIAPSKSLPRGRPLAANSLT
jgi:hypothetical protein